MTKQSTRDKKITADKGKRDASQATLSFIIGLGLVFSLQAQPSGPRKAAVFSETWYQNLQQEY